MWDERYSAGWAYGTDPNDFLRESIAWLSLGPALCLAEGQGRNAVYLASLGFEVTAVDNSAVGLEKAQELAAQRGVQLRTVVADLASYELGTECYSAIVSIFCHLPRPLRRRLHGQVVQALKPGGTFLLEAYRPGQAERSTGGPREKELCMTLAELKSELNGLEFLLCAELEREVREGQFHNGPGLVVQLIARKPVVPKQA